MSSRNSVGFEVSFSSFGHVSDSSSGVGGSRVAGWGLGVSGTIFIKPFINQNPKGSEY